MLEDDTAIGGDAESRATAFDLPFADISLAVIVACITLENSLLGEFLVKGGLACR